MIDDHFWQQKVTHQNVLYYTFASQIYLGEGNLIEHNYARTSGGIWGL